MAIFEEALVCLSECLTVSIFMVKQEIRSLVESEVGSGVIEGLKEELRFRISRERSKNRSKLGIIKNKTKQDPVAGEGG